MTEKQKKEATAQAERVMKVSELHGLARRIAEIRTTHDGVYFAMVGDKKTMIIPD